MSQRNELKIVGVMRFSVLTPTYNSETFGSLEEIAAHLFSPERMALRFRLFEHLVLPALMAQSDPGFDLVVLTAESLPRDHLARLTTALEDLPNVHLRAVGPDKHYQLIKEAYDSVDTGAATHRVMFRLDDDDAVDLDYIRRLRRTARGLLRLQPPDVPQVISFNRGVYLRLREGGNEVFDACERAPLSTGTALLAPVAYHRNPYRYNHRQLPQYYNTYSDITTPAFIRTIHGDNKSTPTQMGLTHSMGPEALDQMVDTHFGLSLAELEAI
jgi:hypothetical protein